VQSLQAAKAQTSSSEELLPATERSSEVPVTNALDNVVIEVVVIAVDVDVRLVFVVDVLVVVEVMLQAVEATIVEE